VDKGTLKGTLKRMLGSRRKIIKKKGVDARMVIRIFCKKIDLYDRERFDSFSTHTMGKI
jgi:hypothetical protein